MTKLQARTAIKTLQLHGSPDASMIKCWDGGWTVFASLGDGWRFRFDSIESVTARLAGHVA